MPKVKNFKQQPNLPKLEEEILKGWNRNDIFKKSVEQRQESNRFVFYDGPPFATGLPHYGHLVASTTKDVIPRYQTMKGHRVDRVWGWDCHGLPIENIIEKELKLKDKQAIEDYGIDNFNNACRVRVLKYADDWKKIINRFGRWVDMDNDYKTMDTEYMESLWWVFKKLWEKNLIYRGHKSMHICPRCSTPLSNFEVSLGYKEVEDFAVTAEFKLADPEKLLPNAKNIYVLTWTTTPWTLPGNVLLAVNPSLEYILFESKIKGNYYLVASQAIERVLKGDTYTVARKFRGKDLTGLSYQPLFPYFNDTKNAFKVVAAEFVSAEEGTGIVHIAPGFGEDDYQLGKREGIPLVQHVKLDGSFTKEVTDFSGLQVKPLQDSTSTDQKIINLLEKKDRIFKVEKIKHTYPHCWRCDTPLINYATNSWFVRVTEIKEQLLKNNQKIRWIPKHIRDGRFGKWLENAKDWAISRNRYWGTPLPIWQSDDGDVICVGSKEELEQLSRQKLDDLHKPGIDHVTITKNGKKYTRIPEVLDCWFESGAMPYASVHYPFENKQSFEDNFPAEFISEGQDQTRGWFYTLHVLATALTSGSQPAIPGAQPSSSFKNVIVNGVILAEDGKKMSKRLKNYPDPMVVVETYGADSLRLYLMNSAVMKGENLNFSEKEVADIRRKVFVIWWNTLAFYKLFASSNHQPQTLPKAADHILDKWLLSKVNSLIKSVSNHFDNYDVVRASRELITFVNLLSTWYLRLSRARLRSSNNQQASHVFGYALYSLAQLFAPLTPFFSEVVHHNMVSDQSSIHLTHWPEIYQNQIDASLEQEMTVLQKIVELGHAARKDKGIKVRQPLASITITISEKLSYQQELAKLVSQELNVKEIKWKIKTKADLTTAFDYNLTPELEREGQARELIRSIQKLRREAGLTPNQTVTVAAPVWPENWQGHIEKQTNTKLEKGNELQLVP